MKHWKLVFGIKLDMNGFRIWIVFFVWTTHVVQSIETINIEFQVCITFIHRFYHNFIWFIKQ